MSELTEAMESIQEDANTKIESICQAKYNILVELLRKRYPKREINVKFGMGTVLVTGFENTRFANPSLDSRYEMWDGNYNSLPKCHPLREMVDLLSEAVYPDSGYSVCCEDIN